MKKISRIEEMLKNNKILEKTKQKKMIKIQYKKKFKKFVALFF